MASPKLKAGLKQVKHQKINTLKSIAWKILPRRKKTAFFLAELCISVHSRQFSITKMDVAGGKIRMAKIPHRSMNFKQDFTIIAKSRLTKYFSFLSTEAVDNFVDKDVRRVRNRE
jgi:hypothetical protein